ncbi:MAG: hypothetical protein JNM43_25540 [Planctomycetaceae bacterium]|nr:hypothetical protein [Planctomycetaceae bacterium]
MFRRLVLACSILFLSAASSLAGNIYEVTSTDGKTTQTYQVRFGGGKLFDTFTAFDPASQKFVYLEWKRSEDAPKPALTFWDHKTGETVALYKFPDVKNPLPVIPSIDDMKVCPMTGDKKFEAKLTIIVD